MPQSIPSYELYGNFLADSSANPVHHETIRERSSKHDWTIRVHRHRRLAQLFLLRSPGVSFRLGEVDHVTAEPAILIVAPGLPHGFRFAEDVLGDVVSIRLDKMPQPLRSRLVSFASETDAMFFASETRHFDLVGTLIEQLGLAYRSVSHTRAEIMESLLSLITLLLAEDMQERTSASSVFGKKPRKSTDLKAEAFCALLEDNFQEPWSVADYARQVGISAPHLTRICANVLGAPPNNLVRQRRILEAKRLLEYTALSVAEIAHRCGFRDAAFFSRAFKENVGKPPQQYRRSFEL